jgi:hypothetical protein
VTRRNHSLLAAAEKLGAMEALLEERPARQELAGRAYEKRLWHDEHTFGYHFPAGAAAINNFFTLQT